MQIPISIDIEGMGETKAVITIDDEVIETIAVEFFIRYLEIKGATKPEVTVPQNVYTAEDFPDTEDSDWYKNRNMPTRPANALGQAGVTPRKLYSKTSRDLLYVRGINEVGVNIIVAFIKKMRLYGPDDIDSYLIESK
jgi:hypothetical protein